ncbi:MAG: hypothetical protein MR398_07375 [Oscillospiraceae bacterium]|nr:hypothetical protein [Oscillospiraceae bacterium]
MKKLKSSNKKLLAILLAVTLIVGTVPIGIFSAFAAEKYSFTVVGKEIDSDAADAAAIEGAAVTVTKTAVDGTETEIFTDNDSKSATTDADGTVDFAALNNYLDANPTAEVSVTLNVTATDYQDVQDAIVTVSAESKPEDRTITMISNPSVTVTKNRDDNVINLYKGTVTDVKKAIEDNKTDNILLKNGAKVPVGSTVTAQVVGNDNDGNYTLEVVPKNHTSADNFYQFTVDESHSNNFQIKFNYTPVKYTVKISANGIDSVILDKDKNEITNEITIDKTAETYELTITPKDEYAEYKVSELKLTKGTGDSKIEKLIDNKKITTNGNSYICKIPTSDIDDSNWTLEIGFKLKQYSVTANTEGDGQVFVNGEQITSGEDLEITAKSKEGSRLIALLITDSEKEKNVIDDVSPSGDGLTYEYTIKGVKSDVAIKAIFDKIDTTTLSDISLNDIINVSADAKDGKLYCKTSEKNVIYYTNDGNVSIIPKGTIESKDNKIIISDIYKIDAFEGGQNKFVGFSKAIKPKFELKNELEYSSVQIKTKGIKGKVFQCKGTLKIIKDTTAPIVTYEPDDSYNNENKSISFKVSDSESGVKQVTVTRSYKDVQNEKVDCHKTGEEKYSFDFEPVGDLTGDVTYTITAVDNVGKDSTKTITIKNDTQAPYLKNTDNKTDAVEFKTANNNVFAHILNKISRGSWFGEKMIVTVKAEDAGVGFGNDAQATIILKSGNENSGETDISARANFDKDGKAEVEFTNLKNFKGSVYYVITDDLGNSSGDQILTTDNCNFIVDDEKNIMLENDAPVIDNIKVDPGKENSYDSKDSKKNIYSGDVKLSFDINDKFDSTIYSGIYSVDVKINGNNVKVLNKAEKDDKNGQKVKYAISYGHEKKFKCEISDKNEKEIKYENITDESNNEVTSIEGLTVSTEGIDPKLGGLYEIDIKATDYAGNVKHEITTVYVDKTAPDINEKAIRFGKDADSPTHSSTYGNDVEVTDYGFYFKKDVNVTVYAEDKASTNETASGVQGIFVYLVDKDGTMYTVDKTSGRIKQIDDISKAEVLKVTIDDNTKDGIHVNASFTIKADFKGQIYVCAVDNVKNKSNYVHPDGSVVESKDKHTETSSIKFTAPKAQGTQNNTYKYRYTGKAKKDADMDYDTSADVPLYNKDITFGVKASDTYSGIKSVTYTVFEGNKKASQTASFDNAAKFENGTSAGWKITEKDKNLVTEITNKIKISGNYNDMVLLVELTDRAGNKSYDYYAFGIDKTAPTITVSYDNNNSDTASGTGDYFSADRTATVLVKERNFNTENVKFTLKNAEGDTPKIIDKGIVNKDKSGNGDENVYKYVIKYNRDGVYSFDVSYTDRAKNKAAVNYGKSVAPKSFILDKTAPTISVAYDNNQAANGKFFKSNRTATITINEHNFDVRRVTVTQTHTLSGQSRDIPAVSWSGSGDTHIGTIHYNTDGDYTFDITMTDKAGNKEAAVNYGNSAAAKDFTVDTDYQNLIKIDGVKNGDVFGKGKDDSYSAKITVNDVNLDDYNVTLTRSRVIVDGETEYDAKSSNSSNNKQTGVKDSTKSSSETNEPVTAMFVKNASGTSNGTATITIPKRDKDGRKNDGLYTLTVTAKDKATNAKSENLTFSVNRFGSVFTFSDDLNSLITSNDGYTQNVTSNDITVYEYNADPAEANNVELISNNDSKKLVNGKDYTRSEEKGVASWYKYSYKISKSNFADDGSYSIRVSSKDSADNISQTSDYPVCSATFYKDSTDPVITSVNYSIMPENNMGKDDVATVNAQDLDITMTIDDAVRLDTVQVYVNEGEADAETYTYTYNSNDKSGNKNTFSDANTLTINNIKIKGTNELKNIFNKDELKQTIKVVAKDKAGNEISTDNKNKFNPGYSFFDVITVSTNPVVRFVSDTTKFWITIASVVAAAVVIAVIVVLAKRKKRSLDE